MSSVARTRSIVDFSKAVLIDCRLRLQPEGGQTAKSDARAEPGALQTDDPADCNSLCNWIGYRNRSWWERGWKYGYGYLVVREFLESSYGVRLAHRSRVLVTGQPLDQRKSNHQPLVSGWSQRGNESPKAHSHAQGTNTKSINSTHRTTTYYLYSDRKLASCYLQTSSS